LVGGAPKQGEVEGSNTALEGAIIQIQAAAGQMAKMTKKP